MKKIVVLVSGQGSNLQALIDACQQGRIAAEIVAVFARYSPRISLTNGMVSLRWAVIEARSS